MLATASEQGTLIRVFDTKTLDQVGEFRRGVEKAIIFGLAFSDGGRWLAATSDKGTVHVFDLRPPVASEINSASSAATSQGKAKVPQQYRKTQSVPHHRLSTGTAEKDSLSGRSSPSTLVSATPSAPYQGSIQEYYGLRPPPSSASPTGHAAAATAISAFKSSSLAPRILKDVRSVVTMPFYTGADPPHWQGGARYSWTTAPGGTRKRVRNSVPGLPNDPAGKPPKGIVAFAPTASGEGGAGGSNDDAGAVFYVLGGGSDARWEMFELLLSESGGWGAINRGFRRYLERQFVD